MIGELARYPTMKDSGVAWLGKVPEHWEVRRNGRRFVERNETGYAGLPILEVSLNTGVRARNFDTSLRKQLMSDHEKYKRAAKGDIAYNMMRMWQGAVGVAPIDGLVSPAYVVARPLAGTVSGYFELLFRTPLYMREVNDCSRGIVADRNRLYWDEFKQMPSPFPPPSEQAAIVRFLGALDRRVNRFIRAKRRLIEVLTEQKQAIITHAVTRGLDPAPRLKPSGIDWLGDVPGHWEVVRFKNRVSFKEGPGIMAADFQDSGVPLLRISCVNTTAATLAGCNYVDPQKVTERWAHFAVKPHDYLLTSSGSTGIVSRATPEVVGAIPYTGIIRLWPASGYATNVDMEFIRYFIISGVFQSQISAAKSGVGIEHFGPTHLKRMWLSLPPINEQRGLVQHIEQSCAAINAVIASAHRETDLIREYRTRLVADVVTGKVDVRTAAPTDVLAEAELADDLLPDEDVVDNEGDPDALEPATEIEDDA